MAKRRALARALSGLGEGIGNAGTYMFRQSQQERMQDRYDQRQTAAQEAMDARAAAGQVAAAERAIDEKVATGEYEPAQAEAMKQRLRGQPASGEDIRPSPRRRMEKTIGAGIESATTPEGIASPESIFGLAEAQGIPSRLPAEWSEGMIPAENDPYQNATPLVREYGERAGARRRSLEAKPTETVNVETDTGAKETRFVSPYAGSVQTSPTSQRQGELAGTQEAAKQKGVLGDEALTALKGQTEGRIQAMVENLTRAAKVQTAAATAGASKRATLAPDIIASEVDRNKQITAGKENSTEGERRAATNFAPLINAHAQALIQEANGVRIGTGDQTMTNMPLLNRAVPAGTQAYMQAARDFISTMGLIRSGVAVPEAEFDRFMSSMFATTGEDSRVVKNKQASREVFISSLQAMVGRSGDDAGRLLATAINSGQVPRKILVTLRLEPEIEKAVLANLKGIPAFDSGGRPITVNPSGLRPK